MTCYLPKKKNSVPKVGEGEGEREREGGFPQHNDYNLPDFLTFQVHR